MGPIWVSRPTRVHQGVQWVGSNRAGYGAVGAVGGGAVTRSGTTWHNVARPTGRTRASELRFTIRCWTSRSGVWTSRNCRRSQGALANLGIAIGYRTTPFRDRAAAAAATERCWRDAARSLDRVGDPEVGKLRSAGFVDDGLCVERCAGEGARGSDDADGPGLAASGLGAGPHVAGGVDEVPEVAWGPGHSGAAYSGHYRTRCFHPLFIMLIVVRHCWKASQDASTSMRAGSSVRDGT